MTAGHNALRGSGGQHKQCGYETINRANAPARPRVMNDRIAATPCLLLARKRPIRRAALRDADVGCIANTRDFKSNLTDLKTSRR